MLCKFCGSEVLPSDFRVCDLCLAMGPHQSSKAPSLRAALLSPLFGLLSHEDQAVRRNAHGIYKHLAKKIDPIGQRFS